MAIVPVNQNPDLSARELFSLAFGAIVGVSWIVLVGQWIGSAGSVGAILAFLVGGILMLPIGQCYAVLGQRLPATGGEFVYAYNLFGHKAAFATAWILSLFYVSVCAFEAVAVAWVVSAMAPGLKGPELYAVAGSSLHLGDLIIGTVVAGILCWLQLRGAQMAARTQDIMVFALVGMAAIFILAALVNGSIANMQPLVTKGSGGFLALLLATPLFYAGFGSVPQALGESSPQARGRLSSVILIVLIASMIFKMGVIMATALVLTRDEAVGAEFPAAVAFEHAFNWKPFSDAALITGLLGLMTTWNAVLYSATRVLFALGRSQLGPVWLARTNPENGAPRLSILLVTAITIIGMPFGKQVLSPVIGLGGLSVTIMFTLVAACLLKIRLKPNLAGVDDEKGRPRLALPLIGLAISLGLLGLNVNQLLKDALDGNPIELLVLAIWALLGVGFWVSSTQQRATVTTIERDRLVSGAPKAEPT